MIVCFGVCICDNSSSLKNNIASSPGQKKTNKKNTVDTNGASNHRSTRIHKTMLKQASNVHHTSENCTKKCRNPDHGDKISRALVNSSLNDEKLAGYIAKTCRNYAHVFDHQGQTALHVATATHKYALVEWLINNGADANLPDKKLGQTALHRAIYHGYFDIALLLLGYGASFEINDFKLKSPVQYCCKPKNYVTHQQSQIKEQNTLKEILVWGNNCNYNLGLENKEAKSHPHFLDCFAKQNVSISSVSLSCYHCLYIDDKGELYAVGLGDGGRLGTNSETTLIIPKKIYLMNKQKHERVISVSTARNHSIALSSADRIFTCGLNTHSQLGQSNAMEKSLIMRDIEIGAHGFKNVIARDYHSLAYTSTVVFVWGTNYGQFGLPPSDTKLIHPTELKTHANLISYVDSSNAAIVCLTGSGLMLLYAKYKMKTIKKPIVHESVKHIAIVGGSGSANTQEKVSSAESLEILVLTQSDSIFMWSYDEQKYLRCFMKHTFSIKSIDWCCDRVCLILGMDGALYRGKTERHSIDTSSPRDFMEEFVEQKSNRKVDISETYRCDIDVQRIPNIDRITNVSVDQRGESFVVLQENSKRYLTIPEIPDDPITFKSLLNETTEFDLLHDVVFHVEDEIFPAHKYIVYSRAEGLRDIVRKYKDKHIYLNFEGLTSKMFELIMKYIYENYTLSLTDIEDVEASFDPYCGLSNLDICTLFREYMGKFGVAKLFDRLMTTPTAKEITPPKLNRLSYPDLYDVTIKCADNAEIRAHRCVLSSRLEYFNLMFNSSWSESTKDVINLITIPHEYMEPIISFLYHNDTNYVRKQQYSDSFLYHLIEICDQFFATRLKNILEVIAIERLNVKKCADMYEFGQTFNCQLLEEACLNYICQNMGRLLENRCLEHLQAESIEKISKFYRQVYQINEIDCTISPLIDDDCVNDADLLAFTDDFSIDLLSKSENATMPTTAMAVKSIPLSVTASAASSSQPVKIKNRSERTSNDRRIYEKEAINLVKNLSIEEPSQSNAPATKKTTPDDGILAEVEQITKSFTNESAKWMKVADKKDVKKKVVLAAIKSNEVLKNEPKEHESFTPLKASRSSMDQHDFDHSVAAGATATAVTSTPTIESSPSSTAYNLSLGDFTPQKSTKLSQKQRKRQLSQSDNVTPIKTPDANHQSTPPSTAAVKLAWNTTPMPTPTSPPEPSNVWKINKTSACEPSTSSAAMAATAAAAAAKTQPINIASTSKTQHTSSINSSASFNDSSFFSLSPTKSNSLNQQAASTSTKSNNTNDSFTKILQDERKQKEYYNKMRSKSLLLTQIEETAIDELKRFYNIDNVHDEHIEIERKSNITPTVNFAKWKQ